VSSGREPGAGPRSARLHWVKEGTRTVPATEALGVPPGVYGERLIPARSGWWRRWDPYRSKLASAMTNGFRGPLPQAGERWLYLGAATGTTASHLADLLGPEGTLYAVEVSLRPFARLLHLGERYPNLLPILGDARQPDTYAAWVPPVDGIYSDVAQPDQVQIAHRNADLYLRDHGTLLVALKLSSLVRGRTPEEAIARALAELRPQQPIAPPIPLEPFHRQHRFLAVGRPARPPVARPGRAVRPPPRDRAGRRS
jgi:fibrillarin-like rRNA methylase